MLCYIAMGFITASIDWGYAVLHFILSDTCRCDCSSPPGRCWQRHIHNKRWRRSIRRTDCERHVNPQPYQHLHFSFFSGKTDFFATTPTRGMSTLISKVMPEWWQAKGKKVRMHISKKVTRPGACQVVLWCAFVCCAAQVVIDPTPTTSLINMPCALPSAQLTTRAEEGA